MEDIVPFDHLLADSPALEILIESRGGSGPQSAYLPGDRNGLSVHEVSRPGPSGLKREVRWSRRGRRRPGIVLISGDVIAAASAARGKRENHRPQAQTDAFPWPC
jgi:hypothetical protein